MDTKDLIIPNSMRPKDGRFGSGPSLIRKTAIDELCEKNELYLGTSHRKSPVKNVVSRFQQGLKDLYGLPEDYKIILGNGGATIFWDVLICSFIKKKSQHLVFGEFSSKFAKSVLKASFLDDPHVIESDTGTCSHALARDDIDTYALIHNETSTGVMTYINRPKYEDGATAKGLTVVDGTSAAGGINFDPNECDIYYFSPQKCLSSEGGLWIAIASPMAVERINGISSYTNRWIPESLNLKTALEYSEKHNTYNTPSLGTILLALNQIEWINKNGGIAWSSSKCKTSSDYIYDWAEKTTYATPFVKNKQERSIVTATIDLKESVDANLLCTILRNNGIVDVESYRKLNRNQIRIACFPSIDHTDIKALLRCIDYVVEAM